MSRRLATRPTAPQTPWTGPASRLVSCLPLRSATPAPGGSLGLRRRLKGKLGHSGGLRRFLHQGADRGDPGA
jgi:hypothetical protein